MIIIKPELKQTMQHKQTIEYIQKLILQEMEDVFRVKLVDKDNFEDLNKKAEDGDFEAQVSLASCYFYGTIFIKQDYTQALKWFEKIAKTDFRSMGYPNPESESKKEQELAQYILVYCYLSAESNVKNEDKAIEWLENAIAQGFDLAKIILADCYFGGVGVQKDDEKAIELLKNVLGLEYEKGPSNDEKIECEGLARRKLGFFYLKENDYSLAIQCFEEAKKYDNDGDSQSITIELGICYYYAKEYKSALDCFNELPEARDGVSQLWLAYLKKTFPPVEKAGSLNELSNSVLTSLGTAPYLGFFGSLVTGALSFFDELNYQWKIDKYLAKSASFLLLKEYGEDYDSNFCDSDMVNYIFNEEIINFLKQESYSSAKVILALYNRDKDEEFEVYLKQASEKNNILAHGLLGQHFSKNNIIDLADNYFDKFLSSKPFHGVEYDNVTIQKIDTFLLEHKNKLLEYKNKQLQDMLVQKEFVEEALREKENELEDMMSMFAHKFRSPLDAIIYNTQHDNQVELYTEAAQTMRGLLNIFSIISTDTDILKDKIKQDNQGSGNLEAVFCKTLDMILLHLLSVSGAEKIQQHYLSYAKAQGQCDTQVSYKTWCEEYFELEQTMQAEWETSYAQLLKQSPTLEQRLAWLEEHFFKLEFIGYDRADIQFKEYGTTESLLTILLNEILVNVFKYYSSESKQAVVLEWVEREGYQVLICRNPSIRSERTIIKGSHKGHVFLSTLARKTDSLFNKPIPQDDFVLEFGLPNELLISK